ncbi:MAG TPA: DUF4157 domain-containing protein, partial [Candidatus Binatia bacterium]|nr:DUF4157 domain-containing protein [Candidatus Binatia bacterium]
PGPRALLEAQFGRGLGDVRVHTGSDAAEAARHVEAAAYTLGRDIAFGPGAHAPHTGPGFRLLSHEVAHVVQSEGAPARPLRAGEESALAAPLEREAERAADAVGRGPTPIRERLAGRMPLRHPVYISGHGKRTFPEKYFKTWGYSPVKTGVMSIEEMLQDLAGKPKIDRVSIVSHANPSFIQMQFLTGGPAEVEKTDWQVHKVADLVNLERHLVPGTVVDTVIQHVNIASPGVLGRLGNVADPFVRQFIWWAVDRVHADKAGYAAALSVKMMQAARTHQAVYQSRLLAGPPAAGRGSGTGAAAATVADLVAADLAVEKEALRWPWSKSPPPTQGQHQLEQRTRESPSAQIDRVGQKPDLFANLKLVRDKITADSWIEILGCNAGADPGYLTAVQGFFTGTAKPKVTAPDWYQFWGHYGFTTVADSDEAAALEWNRKNSPVPAALTYWFPIITRKRLPRRRDPKTLRAYLADGHALPLARPDAPGVARLLLPAKMAEDAFLRWLSRHSYPLTSVAAIQKAMFTSQDLETNVKQSVVEWLQEKIAAPSLMIFRPSPGYDKHIIAV